MVEAEEIEASGPVWVWQPNPTSTARWYFLTIAGQPAAELRYAALGRTGGFGSIRVTATIGITRWQTSLFPHRDSGGLILPLKAAVRQRERIVAGQLVTAQLAV